MRFSDNARCQFSSWTAESSKNTRLRGIFAHTRVGIAFAAPSAAHRRVASRLPAPIPAHVRVAHHRGRRKERRDGGVCELSDEKKESSGGVHLAPIKPGFGVAGRKPTDAVQLLKDLQTLVNRQREAKRLVLLLECCLSNSRSIHSRSSP